MINQPPPHLPDNNLSVRGGPSGVSGSPDGIALCCHQTIEKLSKCNEMMVCPNCRQIIKVFADEMAYRNFVRFCESRGRIIQKGSHGTLSVITYQSFHAANR
jgi:hypothetical protein